MTENTHRWQDGSGKSRDQSEFYQGNGKAPETLLAARWPGEKGIRVSYHRFARGAHISVVPTDHMVVIQPRSVKHIKCRVGDDRLEHSAPARNVTICPSNAPCSAESADDLYALILSVPTQSLAFALADQARPAAHLVSRLEGRDDELSKVGFAIAKEAVTGFPEGPLWWNELTEAFIDRLIDSHLSSPVRLRRGLLDARTLRRVRDFVESNIHRALTISAIAAAAGQDHSHFVRVFSRSVGITPHRYVVQLRLAHALRSIRTKRISFADAATDAGFADQSHLSNWTRRIYGATLKELCS